MLFHALLNLNMKWFSMAEQALPHTSTQVHILCSTCSTISYWGSEGHKLEVKLAKMNFFFILENGSRQHRFSHFLDFLTFETQTIRKRDTSEKGPFKTVYFVHQIIQWQSFSLFNAWSVADINRGKKHLLRKCWTNLRMVKGKFKESCENTVKSEIPEKNGELEWACADIPLHCWRVTVPMRHIHGFHFETPRSPTRNSFKPKW